MRSQLKSLINEVSSVVLGKPKEVNLAVACMLAKGHLLIEDLPGMGKTTLAQTLATSLGLSYQRTQFTSDLLPADILGVSIFNQVKQSFELHKGPIFNQVVLADEINRASPKTQSSLLEAMEEGQVSIDGKTHDLPTPFFVIATQNPTFHAGTYPLPESQLDRFMMRLSLGFPNVASERLILMAGDNRKQLNKNIKVLPIETLEQLQAEVDQVSSSELVLDYIIALCHVSRNNAFNGNPLSPRAGKALLAAAKAWAYIAERNYVTPDDVQAVFSAVCEHRLDTGHNEQAHSSISSHILKQVDAVTPFG